MGRLAVDAHWPSSSTASAKKSGASCGRLWPTPFSTVCRRSLVKCGAVFAGSDGGSTPSSAPSSTIATALRQAAHESPDHREGLENVALAYLTFARTHPALYEAMFTLPSGLRFAQAETRLELRDAFEALAAVVPPSSGDVSVATETLWAALHGLAELERSGRIRQSARGERVALVVLRLFGS